jgi:EmrB/QacA subfamily drug resistance transporter
MAQPDVAPPQSPEVDPGRARRALTAAVLANVLAVIDINVVGVAIPSMLKSFPGTTLPGISWVINGYAVFLAASLLPAGTLADRFGTRRIFLTGIAVFSLGSLACALATTADLLIAARMMQALGGGMMVTLSLTVGLTALPGKPGHVMGLIGGVAGVAAAAGPVVGGALLALGGWRLIFLAVLPVAVVALLLARTAPSTEPAAGTGLPDVLGIALVAGSVGFFALFLTEAAGGGWTSARSAWLGAAAVALTVAAVWRALHSSRPAVDLSLLRRPATAWGNTGLVLLSVPVFTIVVCITLFLTSTWHYSPQAAALALTPGPVASSVGSWSTGRLLLPRLDPRYVTAVAAVVSLAGWCWAALRAGPHPDYMGVVLPALVLGFAGTGATNTAMSATAVRTVPTGRLGTGSALIMLSRSVGAAAGVAILAGLLSIPSQGHFRVVWLGMAGCMALVAAVAFAIPRPQAS